MSEKRMSVAYYIRNMKCVYFVDEKWRYIPAVEFPGGLTFTFTSGNKVICDETFFKKSLYGEPLPNRQFIVLRNAGTDSSAKKKNRPANCSNVTYVSNIYEALDMAGSDETWVIGSPSFVSKMRKYCTICLTHVMHSRGKRQKDYGLGTLHLEKSWDKLAFSSSSSCNGRRIERVEFYNTDYH